MGCWGTYIRDAPVMFNGFTGGVSFPFPFRPDDGGLAEVSRVLVVFAVKPAPFDPLALLPLADVLLPSVLLKVLLPVPLACP